MSRLIIIMTTAPNSAARPATDESGHHDLVKQLFTEAWAQFSGATQSGPTLPAAPPEISSVPSRLKSESPAGVPPVHPSAQPAAPKLSEPEQTPTGAHSPESGDSFAFGEPRCNSVSSAGQPTGDQDDEPQSPAGNCRGRNVNHTGILFPAGRPRVRQIAGQLSVVPEKFAACSEI